MTEYEAIFSRQSVRKYEHREVSEELLEKIRDCFEKTSRLDDNISMKLEILDAMSYKPKFHGFAKVDAPYYLFLYSEEIPGYERNAGFVMEQLVLYMTRKGLGTCFVGGAKPTQTGLEGKKYVLMVAFGYPKGKLERESTRAKRLSLGRLCTYKEEPSEPVKSILKAVRLAPSALNMQPWRFIVYSDRIYIFSYNEGVLNKMFVGMKNFSIGIMLAHVMLTTEELWLEVEWKVEEQYATKTYKNGEYVATLYLK